MKPWRITQVDPQLDILDLGIGQPDFSLLPAAQIHQAAVDLLAGGDPSALNYGYEQGDEGLRSGLADLLGRRAGCPTSPAELLITSGASQALDMICTLFTRPGDTVFVEEPTYFLALRILADHQLNIVGLPLEEDGLDLDRLEKMVSKQRPAFVYTIPTFQNPSGVTLSAEKRARLVELSQKHGFLIVADEVYHLLNYGAPPPPPLAAWTAAETVLSINSFSKILAPGLRLGWIKTAPSLMERLIGCGLVDSGGGLNPFTSAVVRELVLSDQLSAYIDQLQGIYGRRIAVMDRALQTHLGQQVAYQTPTGGYFFWVRLTDGRDSAALLPQAQKEGVGYQPGVKFSSSGGLRDYLRLSFAFWDEKPIEKGIEQLGRAFK